MLNKRGEAVYLGEFDEGASNNNTKPEHLQPQLFNQQVELLISTR